MCWKIWRKNRQKEKVRKKAQFTWLHIPSINAAKWTCTIFQPKLNSIFIELTYLATKINHSLISCIFYKPPSGNTFLLCVRGTLCNFDPEVIWKFVTPIGSASHLYIKSIRAFHWHQFQQSPGSLTLTRFQDCIRGSVCRVVKQIVLNRTETSYQF